MKHALLTLMLCLAAHPSRASVCAGLLDKLLGNNVEDVMSRSELNDKTNKLLGEILETSAAMPPAELESVVRTFAKSMLDRGHEKWREGYPATLAARHLPPGTPNFKKLPKGKEADELLQHLRSLSSGGPREEFLSTYGYRIVQEGDAFHVEQNIDQSPDKLFGPLHKKLNAIHERYALVVGEFINGKIISGEKIKRSDVTQLRSRVHDLWMQDASYKVQPILEKFGIPKDRFYSMDTSEVARACERLVGFSEGRDLAPQEVTALEQFTTYYNLGTPEKLIDDQILFDHVVHLHAAIKSK